MRVKFHKSLSCIFDLHGLSTNISYVFWAFNDILYTFFNVLEKDGSKLGTCVKSVFFFFLNFNFNFNIFIIASSLERFNIDLHYFIYLLYFFYKHSWFTLKPGFTQSNWLFGILYMKCVPFRTALWWFE